MKKDCDGLMIFFKRMAERIAVSVIDRIDAQVQAWSSNNDEQENELKPKM